MKLYTEQTAGLHVGIVRIKREVDAHPCDELKRKLPYRLIQLSYDLKGLFVFLDSQ